MHFCLAHTARRAQILGVVGLKIIIIVFFFPILNRKQSIRKVKARTAARTNNERVKFSIDDDDDIDDIRLI